MKNPQKPIFVRIDDQMRKDFDEVMEITGLGDTQFVKAAIRALVDYVREHGEIRLPLAIIPKSEVAKPFGAAGEKPNAPADGLSTPSTPRFSPDALRLNEEPPTTGPRARSTRRAITKLVEREKGKPA